LSSICSANDFLSLPFSSSNARNRFASDGSMPPCFDVYLKNVAELTPCRRHTSAVFSPLLATNDPSDHLLYVQTLCLDHRYVLFTRKPWFHLSVLLLSGLYTNLEEF
jgi:hypothetical protein